MKRELIIKNEQTAPFSIKARCKSFRYAFEGLRSFFSSQHNAIIHLILTIAAFTASIFFRVSEAETMAIIIVTAAVWSAELFNTAIEKLADMISTESHPEIKFIKDVSAAAVLLSAIAALLTGAIIFLPKLLQ